jgi:hypothetical protein
MSDTPIFFYSESSNFLTSRKRKMKTDRFCYASLQTGNRKDMSMTKERDKFEGLTPEEKDFALSMGRFYSDKGNEAMAHFGALVTEQIRLTILLDRALQEFQELDRPNYLKLVSVVQDHEQKFLDKINSVTERDTVMDHLDARQTVDSPLRLAFPIMSETGNHMRESLINWLQDKPTAQKVVLLLRDVQKYMANFVNSR